jgi:hypothetical protein
MWIAVCYGRWSNNCCCYGLCYITKVKTNLSWMMFDLILKILLDARMLFLYDIVQVHSFEGVIFYINLLSLNIIIKRTSYCFSYKVWSVSTGFIWIRLGSTDLAFVNTILNLRNSQTDNSLTSHAAISS